MQEIFKTQTAIEEAEISTAVKNKEISKYFEGIENREAGIYRLTSDNRFVTDPDGLDPAELFGDRIKTEVLGEFKIQGLASLDEFPEDDSMLYRGPYLHHVFEHNQEHLENLQTTNDFSGKLPGAYLMYEKGSIHLMRRQDGTIVCVLTDHLEELNPYLGVRPEPAAIARLEIWKEDTNKGKLLGLHIDPSYSDFSRPIEGLDDPSLELQEQEIISFSLDPRGFIAETYSGQHSKKDVTRREEGFAELWKKEFKELSKREKWRHFYPGQSVVRNEGLGVEILEQTITTAKKYNFDGITSTPMYFHSAEGFERQGFAFETKEDRARMDMLKIALRVIDRERYNKSLERALGDGVDEREARKLAEEAMLTPQERSWVVLLNSLHNQKLIPKEFNLKAILKKELNKLQDELKKQAFRALDEREEFLRRESTLTEEEYGNLKRQTVEKLNSSDALRLNEYGVDQWVKLAHNRKTNYILWQKGKIDFLADRLFRMKRLDFTPETMTELYRGPRPDVFEPPQPLTSEVRKSIQRMVLRLENKVKTPEFAQEEMDQLIESEVITGNTLHPKESYIADFAEKKIFRGPPYFVVYHMYDKNDRVKQPDGSTVERKNIEHLSRVKSEIEVLGLTASVEKAYGNVKNPGPNHSLGWHAEEPSVWNDELRGIERSSQNVLVITCADIEEVERVAEYLHKIGYKEKENSTQSDPAWYVPDIRILGIAQDEITKLRYRNFFDVGLVKHYKPALLHIKKGEKDGYASTFTHETHRMIGDYIHVPVLIHEAMDAFIKRGEEGVGEYQFTSR